MRMCRRRRRRRRRCHCHRHRRRWRHRSIARATISAGHLRRVCSAARLHCSTQRAAQRAKRCGAMSLHRSSHRSCVVLAFMLERFCFWCFLFACLQWSRHHSPRCVFRPTRCWLRCATAALSIIRSRSSSRYLYVLVSLFACYHSDASTITPLPRRWPRRSLCWRLRCDSIMRRRCSLPTSAGACRQHRYARMCVSHLRVRCASNALQAQCERTTRRASARQLALCPRACRRLCSLCVGMHRTPLDHSVLKRCRARAVRVNTIECRHAQRVGV